MPSRDDHHHSIDALNQLGDLLDRLPDSHVRRVMQREWQRLASQHLRIIALRRAVRSQVQQIAQQTHQ